MGVGTLGENECNEKGVRSRSPRHWVGRDAQQLGRAKSQPEQNRAGAPRCRPGSGRILGPRREKLLPPGGEPTSAPCAAATTGLQTKAKMKGLGEQWVSLARQRAPRQSVRALLRTKHRPTDAGDKLGGARVVEAGVWDQGLHPSNPKKEGVKCSSGGPGKGSGDTSPCAALGLCLSLP